MVFLLLDLGVLSNENLLLHPDLGNVFFLGNLENFLQQEWNKMLEQAP